MRTMADLYATDPREYLDRCWHQKRVRTKTEQMNMKVTPEFKAKVAAIAKRHGVSQPELLERAIEALEMIYQERA